MSLVNGVVPPLHPRACSGDRSVAHSELGYELPESFWSVIETYGASSWLDWLLLPSPYSADGVEELIAHADVVREARAGARLVAFDDIEKAWVFLDGTSEQVSTLDDAGEVRTTGLALPDFLSEWLGGRGDAPMATPLELTGDAMIPAFVVPIVDPDRASRLVAAYTKRGDSSRAERWDAFARGIGAHVPMSVVSEGETKQNKIYLPDLEATVLFDSYGRDNDVEHLHVT